MRIDVASAGSAVLIACGLMLLPALQGCAGTSQTREQQAATAQQAQVAEDDAKCKAAGAAPDTPAYVQCRDRLVQKRMEEEAAQVKRREAFQKTLGEGTSAASGL